MAEEKKYYGTGRRKSSVARVWAKAGKGSILVNGVAVEQYMPYATLVQNLKQPLTLTGSETKNMTSSPMSMAVDSLAKPKLSA